MASELELLRDWGVLAAAEPWGGMDPNSANQCWVRWEFSCLTSKRVPFIEFRENMARWARKGFGSTGQIRCDERAAHNGWRYSAQVFVEGNPSSDPDYRKSVEAGWQRFVEAGWGTVAVLHTQVAGHVMAGMTGDGGPPNQLVVMPPIEALPKLFAGAADAGEE